MLAFKSYLNDSKATNSYLRTWSICFSKFQF